MPVVGTEQPLTLTQRVHAAETERDNANEALVAAQAEITQMADAYYSRQEALQKSFDKQKNGLQNEVGMLRSILARLTYGGVHVRDVESIGAGAR